MSPEELVKKYLSEQRVMQLATVSDNQPWACNIHYYSDDNLNFYWISTTDRRHSQDIAQNSQVAAAVLVHEDVPGENYVIGISVEGQAELIGQNIDEQTAAAYLAKLGKEPSLIKDIASGQNPHKFYRLVPSKIVLFDSKNFPKNPRQEFTR